MTDDKLPAGPLRGIKVLDASTILAGPLAAQILGDFGAEVIKIEHPAKPDGMRGHGLDKNGVPLWWKMVSRNKQTVTLNLSTPEGQEIFRDLAAEADVVVENFRPGTFERWGLSYAELAERNPALIMLRVTGFGQQGPYATRPAFGTLVESMSGFAHLTGHPDGLPPCRHSASPTPSPESPGPRRCRWRCSSVNATAVPVRRSTSISSHRS